MTSTALLVSLVPGGGGGGGGGGAAALLGSSSYADPSSDVVFNSTASATYADVDATNAVVSFTAPTSGKVLVKASVPAQFLAAGQGGFGLRSGSSDVAGSKQLVLGPAGALEWRVAYSALITGLTGGAALTYKLSFAKISGGTFYLNTGPGKGPLVMEVWSV